MAKGIAPELAYFLDCCGVRYPDIDEGEMRGLAVKVRAFATNILGRPATGISKGAGSVDPHLVATKASASAEHLAELDRACAVVAKALDAVAQVITATKTVVLAELAALATTYAAIMATPAAGTIGPSVAAAARRLCSQLERTLVGYIVADAIAKSLEPLGRSIDTMLTGVFADANPSDGRAQDLLRHTVSFAEEVAETSRGLIRDGGTGLPAQQQLKQTRPRGFVTPWARAIRASTAHGTTPKVVSARASRSVDSRATTARKPRETPWSKLARQPEVVRSTVTVPTVRRRDRG
ncbi:hypothetical protein OG874_22410 [Nocardia sp. NBC_00565]|uniref:hypothetical protein n=1 Tax=Nocardia sp. NBC_00565 TaxID=2975993 RepID=UPI002E7FCC70|nr:hypothetical protein [Nocardia sp. NBC_00565]WUC07672.1 hypothetical protein OG874_22410 [Nocardia sp. NBC_00565]